MNFLGFGQSAEVEILFEGADTRKSAEVKTEDGKKEKYLLYYDGETVSGRVNVTLKKPGTKLEHQGIKIELIGQIELFYDRGNHHEFTSIVKELARPGDLLQNTSYPFEFPNVEKPYEVYVGSNVRLRYFLRVTIVRRLSDIIKEVDIAVHQLSSYPELNNPIKMEVGIEDCLHIEFEYNKCKYHLKDVIVGKIYFLLVRIKIKHMEIAIIKRETTGTGPNTFTENETIAKYEIMDGAPVKGESIPIRVFLAGYDLTPTMRDVNKKFSVKYFLNLVLMDTEDRRYFKQQEITLWRKADKSRKSQAQAANPHVPTHLVGGPDNEMSASKYPSASSAMKIAAENAAAAQSNEAAGDGEEEAKPDNKMGLFTRESPEQEKKQIPGGDGDQSQQPTVAGNPSAPQQQQQSISTEMQRGTADGASAKSDGPSEDSGPGLFDTASSSAAVPAIPATSATPAAPATEESPEVPQSRPVAVPEEVGAAAAASKKDTPGNSQTVDYATIAHPVATKRPPEPEPQPRKDEKTSAAAPNPEDTETVEYATIVHAASKEPKKGDCTDAAPPLGPHSPASD